MIVRRGAHRLDPSRGERQGQTTGSIEQGPIGLQPARAAGGGQAPIGDHQVGPVASGDDIAHRRGIVSAGQHLFTEEISSVLLYVSFILFAV
jgi:hypothetical protein